MNVEISPLLCGFIWKFRRIIAQAGVLWLKTFCVIAERHTGVPWSLHTRRSTAVLPSSLAETSRELAASEGPCYLWGEGISARAGPVSPARKALTMGRLTEGHGTAGLPSHD
jgi:hypothetical protein